MRGSISPCTECGNPRKKQSRSGLCRLCWKIKKQSTKLECQCGRTIMCRGMCERCYHRWRYINIVGLKKQKLLYGKQWRTDLKKEIMSHYGALCACCGESEIVFLSIDHINGDGYQRRKLEHGAGQKFYYWLKKNGFPSDFQILCFNCNWAKRLGECPHNARVIT